MRNLYVSDSVHGEESLQGRLRQLEIDHREGIVLQNEVSGKCILVLSVCSIRSVPAQRYRRVVCCQRSGAKSGAASARCSRCPAGGGSRDCLNSSDGSLSSLSPALIQGNNPAVPSWIGTRASWFPGRGEARVSTRNQSTGAKRGPRTGEVQGRQRATAAEFGREGAQVVEGEIQLDEAAEP